MLRYEEVLFKKGTEFYRLRWTPGEEDRAFEELYRWVDDPEVDFDGIDARIMAEIVNERARNRENTNE